MPRGMRSRGFTMIEVVVVIAILAIIIAIAGINYRTYKNNLQMREDIKSFEALLQYAQQESKKVLMPLAIENPTGGCVSVPPGPLPTAGEIHDMRIDVCSGASTAPLRSMTIRGTSIRHNLLTTFPDKTQLGIHVDFYDAASGAEQGSIGFFSNGIAFSHDPTNNTGPFQPMLIRMSRGTLGFDFFLDASTGAMRYTDFVNAY